VKKRIFCGNSEEDIARQIININYDVLPQGGTVAHLCTSLAAYMGCKNIILIGQDLAYTENKIHDETSFDEKQENNDAKKQRNTLIETRGNYEEKVITDYSMNNMRIWFEKLIDKNPEYNYINCTEGGAFINGTKVQKFCTTLEDLNLENIYPLESINSKLKDFALGNDANIITNTIEKLKKFKTKLLKGKDLVIKGKEQSKKMIKYYNGELDIDIKLIFKELDEIDNFINNDEKMKVIINLCMENFYEVMVFEDYRIKNSDNETIKGQKIAKKCIKMYESLEISLNKILPLVDNAINDIQSL
jgi:hypothetical protein